jgi:hypothetical protein
MGFNSKLSFTLLIQPNQSCKICSRSSLTAQQCFYHNSSYGTPIDLKPVGSVHKFCGSTSVQNSASKDYYTASYKQNNGDNRICKNMLTQLQYSNFNSRCGSPNGIKPVGLVSEMGFTRPEKKFIIFEEGYHGIQLFYRNQPNLSQKGKSCRFLNSNSLLYTTVR